MYRHYAQGGRPTLSVGEKNRNRAKNLLIAILVTVLVVLAVYGIPAIMSNRDMRTVYIRRMLSECEEAQRQTNSLSRNAGAGSSAILAKVRSNVYAIAVLNQMSTSLRGNTGPLISETVLDELKNSIDLFLNDLRTGMDTGDSVTDLQNSLNQVQSIIEAMD